MSPKREIFSIEEVKNASKPFNHFVAEANRSDADLELQLDLARRNSVSVAISGYTATHGAYGSISGNGMRYQGMTGAYFTLMKIANPMI
jgi:hypothetical protein